MVYFIILLLSWYGIAAFGVWLYQPIYVPSEQTRWFHYLIALSLGWFWLIPICLYPFLRDQEDSNG
jgi:hypothetical protein